MLQHYVEQFLQYCKTADFAERSIEALTGRLQEFKRFVEVVGAEQISALSYQQLLNFVADFQAPSLHVKKNRIWALHQFYHFLKLNNFIEDNPASLIPYPKIGRTVPHYLTIDEFNQVLRYFVQKADSVIGLRNLIIIMLLGFLGLRILAVIRLNIEDVDVDTAVIWAQEKGRLRPRLSMPQVLCTVLRCYLAIGDRREGPLLVSNQNKRISDRTIENLLKNAMNELKIHKHLHAHLFRHTAATHLSKVAGPEITQEVLGHAKRSNTDRYTHLNPDVYAFYMKKHPYMNEDWR